jgi:uncharacterized protein (TIGR00296 family)
MWSLEHGTAAVRIARDVIESALKNKTSPVPDYPPKFKEKGGVFVTLNTHPEHDLRGCIGYPEPVLSTIDALRNGAKSAAISDPRFPSVELEEMDNIVVEVTMLTTPKIVKVDNPKQYLKVIKVGRDGLIAERGPYRGLLLPQVPVEWGWDSGTFLAQTCVKAGLPPYAWNDKSTNIYRFEGTVFMEEKPRGNIVVKKLEVKGS